MRRILSVVTVLFLCEPVRPQIARHGDIVKYIENPSPIEEYQLAPHVPNGFNPSGYFIRNFEVPGDWKGMKTILHFDSVKATNWVWIRPVNQDLKNMIPLARQS